ncbi:hypothetical protein [uncultured Tateyamaria sp.]|uniref:hypothetical protein n=1 Tax=Tateyamaria sp. 1078 TaxID=3417464 RepID=UPI00261D61E8|nr:hypothetical protein [uncultured Tateyamaria sp.]
MSGFAFWKKKRTRNRRRNRVQVDRRAAVAAWKQLPSFAGLRLVIGQNHADAVIQVYEEYIERAVRWMDYEEDAAEMYAPLINGYLLYETRMILDVQAQINGLWARCSNCELEPLLRRNNIDPFEWRIPTNPMEDDLWKGVNWVNSHDPSVEARRKTLRLMMILHRDYDVRQKNTFDRANHELIGAEVMATPAYAHGRMVNRGGAYPSSAGAKWLTEHIERLAMTLQLTPGDQSRRWDDLACFLYGAYIRAQSAPDGNKRTSRAIFIATLRKGGRDIRVPNTTLAQTLLGPNFIR